MTEEITDKWLMDLGFVDGFMDLGADYFRLREKPDSEVRIRRIDGRWLLEDIELGGCMTRTRLLHLMLGLGHVIHEYTDLSPDEAVVRGDECRSRQNPSQGWMETAVRGAQSTEHEYRRPTNNLQEQIKCTQ